MVSTWLLSLLEREYQLLKHGFPAKYPGPWLIWEPGEWRPAKTRRESNLTPTVDLAMAVPPARPAGTDAFCFQLRWPARGELTVGRASESDVLINDLTLSRDHLRLRAGEVSVALGCASTTSFDGNPGAPGQWHALQDGLRITTGAVTLTWLETGGMLTRLARR
jgi:hypothetical protein